MPVPVRGALVAVPPALDPKDAKGWGQAKRGLEIVAAGGHDILLVGPPRSDKSMLAQRLPGLLPPLTPEELLKVSEVQSLAGLLEQGRLTRDRPVRTPQYSASMAALAGTCGPDRVSFPLRTEACCFWTKSRNLRRRP